MISAFFFVTLLGVCLSFATEFSKRGDDGVLLTIWKYLSYYTTLSNLLVLVSFGALAFWPESSLAMLFKNANIAAAIAFYITTVGIANYLIFGWLTLPFVNRIADLLVHAITPIMAFCYWLFLAEKGQLEYSLLGYWFIFPLGYAFYTMLHGKWSRFYPYEFTNIQVLGLKKVMLNAVGLSVCLLIGGALFILLGKTVGQLQ